MYQILLISICTLLASIIGTISGFGVSTIMIPILLPFYPMEQVLFLVGIIHWVQDIGKMYLFWGGVNWRLFVLFGIPALFASFVGAFLIVVNKRHSMDRLVGIFFIGYALFLLWNPRFKISNNPWILVPGGAISGFCAGLFGIQGALKSVFLSGLDLSKRTYIATMAVMSLGVDAVRVGTYWYGGITLPLGAFTGLIFFIPASLIGAVIGKYCVDKIPQDRFRLVVAFFILLMGIRLVLFPVT